MKDNKKKFIQIFAIALILVLIASSTYAYFASQIGDGASTNINVTTSTVDNLTFETGDAISISATQSNFTEGAGNRSDDTYASATLVANNDTNEASANYYLYINIDSNEFEYTTSDSTAELVLTITDPDGNEVTSLSGLTYTSVTDGDGNTVSGFDITTKTGLITVAREYLIESTGTNTQKWNIEVTLVNLDSDQSDNSGKSFSASIVIQSDVYGYNILQAVDYNYSGEFWAYKSSVTKIVFDDTGNTISDYEEVYDITEAGYCHYDGNEVYNFNNWSTDGVTESSCNIVYKVIDDDYIGYFDDSYTSYITEYGTVVWDSEDNVCKTSDGNEVYTWYYWNSPTEEQCSGVVHYFADYDVYLVGAEYVGSGEWINSVGNIQAYLVSNDTASTVGLLANTIANTTTYTVYIVSDAPIQANVDMSYWFNSFTSLETIDGLDKINTSNVTNMEGIFYGNINLISLDLSSWDTSSVTNMSKMFSSYSLFYSMNLESITFGQNWDTSNVTDMSDMFYKCSSLTSLDLSTWITTSLQNMSYMFYGCNSLTSLDLNGWNLDNLVYVDEAFCTYGSLNTSQYEELFDSSAFSCPM